MESEANHDTFGSYLKRCRLNRDLSVEAVAARTKISAHCLRAIEENAHDRLPPRAYVKSFIRAYAEAVGADRDVAINLYLSDLEWQAITRKQHLKRQAKLSVMRRLLMVAGVTTSVLLMVRYTNLFPDTAAPPGTTPPGSAALPASPVSGAQSPARQPDGEIPTEKLKLRVVAVERTWLKIIVDGGNARSYNLKPADRLELEGTRDFNLMIGDATGVRIFLDDRPVKIYGSSGQVVSLKIP